MKDPYSTLGVSRNATDDEIKKAYRELAKKYHPDNYADSPLSDLVTEKMKEINEAYDTIQKERAGGGAGAQNNGGYSYSSGSSKFAEVRRLINAGSYAEAEVILSGMSSVDRNAEWNFLMGILYHRRGWYHDAAKHFDIACSMDPSNAEYRMARQRMSNGSTFMGGTAYSQSDRSSELEFCSLCGNLLCADACCECCGGDIIPCC